MRRDSPEDRLLNLIKGKHKKKDALAPAALDVKEPFLTYFARKIILKNRIFKPLVLKRVNRVLASILAILLVYLIYRLYISITKPYEDIDLIVAREKAPSLDTDIAEAPDKLSLSDEKDYSVYSKSIGKKELFTAPIVKEKEAAPQEIDISKRFNLVGIITGALPQAIIEDKETQKTHYLYKGQSFDAATVMEIGDGRVILEYKGKEIILVL